MHSKLVVLVALPALLAGVTHASAAVEISSKTTLNMNCSGGVCMPTAKRAILNVSDLAGMLASGAVTVSSGEVAEDITVDAPLSWTSAKGLTLDAYRSVNFKKPVTVAGTGALTIDTNDGGTGGDFRFFGRGHVEFWDLGSSLTINGDSYVLFKTIKQLAHLVKKDSSKNFALAKSFNASNSQYMTAPVAKFQSKFEGLGNTISNLNIAAFNPGDAGLFGAAISPSTVIRDVGLVNVDITAGMSSQCLAGLIATLAGGTVANAYVTGSITARSGLANVNAGGLVCKNEAGSILNSYANASISDLTNAPAYTGGLVAIHYGFESSSGMISESYAEGTVAGGDGDAAGGLVGNNEGGAIANSYATAATSGGSDSFVGGLVGINQAYSEGQSRPSIVASYSTGAVSGGSDATLGGLLGQDLGRGHIAKSYWDLDSSDIGNPAQGAGNVEDDPGITGMTTIQFQAALPAGFAGSVWQETSGINNGLPYLRSNPPQ